MTGWAPMEKAVESPEVTIPSTSASSFSAPVLASSSATAVAISAPATGLAADLTSTKEPSFTPAGSVAPAASVTW